ncbi:hypothetical protein [Lacrimispora sp.]|uniref:hypothetical protein n=1 Tax=Lacrimispora sp. TaxID=2719234 RepID=UPI00289FFC08|nr:hypothetical protein [Lacrimispora sp.]
MKKRNVGLLIFALVSVVFILSVWFGQKRMEIPFSAADVKDIAIYQYIVPAEAEKKVVTAEDDIESILQTFNTIKVKRNRLEPISGATTTSFRSNLKDGTDFNIIYINHSVKLGEIKSSYAFDYETTADIEEIWNNYNYDVSAAEESELPTYEQ